jgi:hypothetical protein
MMISMTFVAKFLEQPFSKTHLDTQGNAKNPFFVTSPKLKMFNALKFNGENFEEKLVSS